MNVLVTGGAGFIGSHVVDRLIARGDHVVVLDNLDPQVHAGRDCPNLGDARARARTNGASNLRFVEGDVRDPTAVRSVLEGIDTAEIAPRILSSTRKGDIRCCVGDNTAIRRNLGWEPRIRFEDGLTELIEWSRKQAAKDLTLDAQRELAAVELVHG